MFSKFSSVIGKRKISVITVISFRVRFNIYYILCCSYVGQFVAYAHEEEGLNVASIVDDTQATIHIPTAVSKAT